MEVKLTDLTLPTFLWYVLPGINLIAIDVLFPILLLEPQQLTKMESLGGVVLLGVAALAIGFIMDSVKLYQFSWKYKSIHDSFFSKLGEALNVPAETAHLVFGAFRLILQEKGGALGQSAAFDHARWVMINLTSKCFYALAVIWAGVAYGITWQAFQPFFMEHLTLGRPAAAAVSISVIATSILAAGRLSKVARYHRELTAQKYLYCAESHRADLIRELRLMGDERIAANSGPAADR